MSEVLVNLKNTTKHLHDQLEAVSYSREMMSHQITKGQYLAVLRNNQRVYAVVEPLLKTAIKAQDEELFTHFISHRLKDLKRDLSYFPSTSNTVDPTVTFPLSINNPARLLGLLYVLEGARLGGKVIVKALQKNDALKDIPTFHFYGQKDIHTRDRWMTFRSLAERVIGTNEERMQEASLAAREMFTFFMPE